MSEVRGSWIEHACYESVCRLSVVEQRELVTRGLGTAGVALYASSDLLEAPHVKWNSDSDTATVCTQEEPRRRP